MNLYRLFGNSSTPGTAATRKQYNKRCRAHDGKIFCASPPRAQVEYKEAATQHRKINSSTLRTLLENAPVVLIPAAAADCLNPEYSNYDCVTLKSTVSNATYILATTLSDLASKMSAASAALAKINFTVVADAPFNLTYINDDLCSKLDEMTGVDPPAQLIAGLNTSIEITPAVKSLIDFLSTTCTQVVAKEMVQMYKIEFCVLAGIAVLAIGYCIAEKCKRTESEAPSEEDAIPRARLIAR